MKKYIYLVLITLSFLGFSNISYGASDEKIFSEFNIGRTISSRHGLDNRYLLKHELSPKGNTPAALFCLSQNYNSFNVGSNIKSIGATETNSKHYKYYLCTGSQSSTCREITDRDLGTLYVTSLTCKGKKLIDPKKDVYGCALTPRGAIRTKNGAYMYGTEKTTSCILGNRFINIAYCKNNQIATKAEPCKYGCNGATLSCNPECNASYDAGYSGIRCPKDKPVCKNSKCYACLSTQVYSSFLQQCVQCTESDTSKCKKGQMCLNNQCKDAYTCEKKDGTVQKYKNGSPLGRDNRKTDYCKDNIQHTFTCRDEGPTVRNFIIDETKTKANCPKENDIKNDIPSDATKQEELKTPDTKDSRCPETQVYNPSLKKCVECYGADLSKCKEGQTCYAFKCADRYSCIKKDGTVMILKNYIPQTGENFQKTDECIDGKQYTYSCPLRSISYRNPIKIKTSVKNGCDTPAPTTSTEPSKRVVKRTPTPTRTPKVVVKNLTPRLECITDNGDKTLTAYFGYENKLEKPIEINVGNRSNETNLYSGSYKSMITVSTNDDAPKTPTWQMTKFLPGVHKGTTQVVFNENSSVSWSLRNTNEDIETVVANKNSTKCENVIPKFEGFVQDLFKSKIAIFSYDNKNEFPIYYPKGVNNLIIKTSKDGQKEEIKEGLGQPELFFENSVSPLEKIVFLPLDYDSIYSWQLPDKNNNNFITASTKDKQGNNKILDEYECQYLTNLRLIKNALKLQIEDYDRSLVRTYKKIILRENAYLSVFMTRFKKSLDDYLNTIEKEVLDENAIECKSSICNNYNVSYNTKLLKEEFKKLHKQAIDVLSKANEGCKNNPYLNNEQNRLNKERFGCDRGYVDTEYNVIKNNMDKDAEKILSNLDIFNSQDITSRATCLEKK
ncbi:MAG: hypothetical protein ACOX3T_05065 [Bdellovibrionota bacterium]